MKTIKQRLKELLKEVTGCPGSGFGCINIEELNNIIKEIPEENITVDFKGDLCSLESFKVLVRGRRMNENKYIIKRINRLNKNTQYYVTTLCSGAVFTYDIRCAQVFNNKTEANIVYWFLIEDLTNKEMEVVKYVE